MTDFISTDPSSADLLLFTDPGQAVTSLAHAIDAEGVLDNVKERAGKAEAIFGDVLKGRVAEAGGELLKGLSLGGVLLGGWQRYRGLREAARRTLDDPGTSETVRLAQHTITSQHSPYVDVRVSGQPLGRITFGIALTFDIEMLQAGVLAGRLMRLGAGDCTAGITWSVQGFEVARKEFVLVSLPASVTLGDGIPILRHTPRKDTG